MLQNSIIKNFTNLFSSQPRNHNSSSQKKETILPRIIDFGKSDKKRKFSEKEKSFEGQFIDFRYHSVEQNTKSLNQLGLKNEDILGGQMLILYEDRFFSYKTEDQKYYKTLFILSNYKICLKPKNRQEFYFFPLGKIDRVQKYTTNEKVCKLIIHLKDGRKFKFKIDFENIWSRIAESIEKFAFIKFKKQFFAFKYFEQNKKIEKIYEGWNIYDPIRQLQRIGLQIMAHSEENNINHTSDFKILDNKGGKVCETYPEILVVPSRISYESLIKCAKFRSKQRLPALSFAFEYEKGKFSCVYRSSQGKVGMQSNRSPDDELMLKMIGNPNSNTKGKHEKKINCKIYDARGYLAALGNRFQGKGYENIQYYQNCTLQFLNIPNIHIVRQSYNKLIEASYGPDYKFYSSLAESKWYEYIFLILSGALELSKTLAKGINSLVHCSDGWDRTAQLCTLTSIILDPYYRTIKGFQILIQKDWIYFGHQFGKRLGQGLNKPGSEEKSQVFLQYLDCVTQIMHQFPQQFEFNYHLIDQIQQHAYSHLYGNFLCDCHLQMVNNEVKQKTMSLWSKVENERQKYENRYYIPSSKKLLNLDISVKSYRFWKQHFLKYVDEFRDVYSGSCIRLAEQNLKSMYKEVSLTQEEDDDDSFSILEQIQQK